MAGFGALPRMARTRVGDWAVVRIRRVTDRRCKRSILYSCELLCDVLSQVLVGEQRQSHTAVQLFFPLHSVSISSPSSTVVGVA
jgi:hypothetical protein